MKMRIRWALSIAIGITWTTPALAQFFPPPVVPVVGVPVLVPNGIDFRFKSRNLRVKGFIGTGGYTPGVLPIAATGGFPFATGQPLYLYTPGYFPQLYSPYSSYPFGVQSTIQTLHIINPPGVVNVRRALGDDFDIAGIDLDKEPADKIWNRNAGQPKVMKAAQKEGDEGKAQPAKAPPPAEREVAAPVTDAPAAKPKAEIVPVWQRLMDMGTESFRDGEYGLALARFRQASDQRARAHFLEAHASLAVGKYKNAVELIQQGLMRDPAWPQSGFRPRIELYENDDTHWRHHLTRLEDAQRKQPLNADYRFLLGYLAWFDGDRAAAVEHFQLARGIAEDTRWADLFLKAAVK